MLEGEGITVGNNLLPKYPSPSVGLGFLDKERNDTRHNLHH